MFVLAISRPRRLHQAGRAVVAATLSPKSKGVITSVRYLMKSKEGCKTLKHGGATARLLVHIEGEELQECELEVIATASGVEGTTVPIDFSPIAPPFKKEFGTPPAGHGSDVAASIALIEYRHRDQALRDHIERLLDQAGEDGESAERLATLIRDAIGFDSALQSKLGCSADLHRDKVTEVCTDLSNEGKVFHNGKRNKGSRWIHRRYRAHNAEFSP